MKIYFIFKHDALRICVKDTEGGWFIPDKLPDPLPLAMRNWLDAIINDAEILYDTSKGTALTELLENAYISHKEQKIVAIK